MMHQNSNNIFPDCKQTDSRTLNTSLTTPDGWQQCKFDIAVIIICIVVNSHPIITFSLGSIAIVFSYITMLLQ